VSVEHVHGILILNRVFSCLPLLFFQNLFLSPGVEELLTWVSSVARIVHAGISTTCNDHAFQVWLLVVLQLSVVASVDLHLVLRIDAGSV